MERARSPHLMCVPCGLDPSRRMTFRDAFQSLTGNGAHGMELLPRHCEEPLRRSNPFSPVREAGLLSGAGNDVLQSEGAENAGCSMPQSAPHVPPSCPRMRIGVK